MEEIVEAAPQGEREILVFLEKYVREKIEKQLYPTEIETKITDLNEIMVWIKGALLTARDIIMLKELEKMFKTDYYEYIEHKGWKDNDLIILLKPKKSAIKMAQKLMKLGVI